MIRCLLRLNISRDNVGIFLRYCDHLQFYVPRLCVLFMTYASNSRKIQVQFLSYPIETNKYLHQAIRISRNIYNLSINIVYSVR